MHAFLTRFRSSRSSKTTSAPALEKIETGVKVATRHEEHDAQTSQDASPDSPSQNVELESKIHPDLSALFASVEDALDIVERNVETQKRPKYIYEDNDDGTSENEQEHDGMRSRMPEGKSLDDGTIFESFGSGLGVDWSSFGQDTGPRPDAIGRTHTTRAINTNFFPSSAEAILSWSPKPLESTVSLRPSSSNSHSSPALSPSLEIQQSTRQSGPYTYSPSPGTFGFPSPVPHTPTSSTPHLPPPVFHSTPKTSTPRIRSAHKRSPGARRRRITGIGAPPLPTSAAAGRMKRIRSEQPVSSRRLANGHINEPTGRLRTFSRSSNRASQGLTRRKSAEWTAHAASAGVVADPAQTTEFGWPAAVSREILRLSLGEQAMWPAQDAPSLVIATAPETAGANNLPDQTETRSSKLLESQRGVPRVSHEHKHNARQSTRLIRTSTSGQRLSSAHLLSSTPPSPSYAPGRNGEPRAIATQSETTDNASASVATRRTVKARSQSSGNNTVDSKPDTKMGAAGVAEHKRSDSENMVEWGSHSMQDFLSPEERNGDASAAALRPSTPMKKSESESTYETAGSSSFLHAPSLSVIAPTPRGSPGRSKNSLELEDGLQVPTPPPESDKSRGKRKAEESEDGSPPDLRGSKSRKSALAAEGKGNRSHSNSNASYAPSSFQSFQSQKSRKRVRLSSPMATPAHSRPGSAVQPHSGSVSSRGSSRSAVPSSHIQHVDSRTNPPRPPSRMSRGSRTSRAMSQAVSGASSGAGTVPFPKRRSLSQSSIPLSAIVTPRAPSIDRLSQFHMRDPQKPPPRRDIGWTLRFGSADDKGSPFMAWAFWFGFLFPLLWWFASFWRIPKTRMVGIDTEKAVIVDDPFIEREAHAWRLRCRVASVVFFFTYLPVIVLLAVFAPR